MAGTRRIEYSVTSPGAKTENLAEGDDPNSSSFVPLEDRTEMDKARFWSLVAQGRTTRPKAGVF